MIQVHDYVKTDRSRCGIVNEIHNGMALIYYHNGIKITTTAVALEKLKKITKEDFLKYVQKKGCTSFYSKVQENEAAIKKSKTVSISLCDGAITIQNGNKKSIHLSKEEIAKSLALKDDYLVLDEIVQQLIAAKG